MGRHHPLGGDLRGVVAARPLHRRRVHAASRRRIAVGARHDALHHLVRGGVETVTADPRSVTVVSAGHRRHERAGTAG